MRLPTTISRGVATIDDLRERCRIDPVTPCWHWLGGTSCGKPVLFVFDHERGKKRVMPGPRAAFCVCFGRAPIPGWKVVRTCTVGDCLAPYHLKEVRTVPKHQARTGVLKGIHLEQKRAALAKARAVKGDAPDLTEEQVLRVRQQLGKRTQYAIAADLGVARGVINRIAVGRAYTWVQGGAAA